MERRLIMLSVALLSLVSVGTLAVLVFSLRELPQGPVSSQSPAHHFAMVLEQSNDPASQSFRTGCRRAAEEFNAVLEFLGPRYPDAAEQAADFETALWIGVDGIGVQVSSEDLFSPLVKAAADRGIPVVTLSADTATDRRLAFIGSSSYELGRLEGKLAAEALPGRARVAALLPDAGQSKSSAYELRMAGFLDAIKGNPALSLDLVRHSDLGVYSAEAAARDILLNHPEINLIVCNTPADTVGVAQTLVDFNRVGKVSVIGFGKRDDIETYIAKGVVHGSVAPDLEQAGYEAVRALAVHRGGGRVSTFITTNVNIVTGAGESPP